MSDQQIETTHITEVCDRWYNRPSPTTIGIWTDTGRGWTLPIIEHSFAIGDLLVICHEPVERTPQDWGENEPRRIVWYTINGGPEIRLRYDDAAQDGQP